MRFPTSYGSAGAQGAPGGEWPQPRQSGTRGPRLSHRGEQLGRRSGTRLRSPGGRPPPVAHRSPSAAARAGKGCCARAAAAGQSGAGRAGREGRSAGSTRGDDCKRMTKRGREAVRGFSASSSSLRRCSPAADRGVPARQSRSLLSRRPGPKPSRRPPGSTPARAAHALRPPLKGPVPSPGVLLLPPPPRPSLPFLPSQLQVLAGMP